MFKFTNARLYSLPEPFAMDQEKLEAVLDAHPARTCGAQERQCLGWDEIRGAHRSYWADGFVLLRAKSEERIIPSAGVRDAVEKRAKAIEESQNREVGKKERRNLKEEIEASLLPKALCKSRTFWACIDTRTRWMLIDATSAKHAETVISLLREGLDHFPAKPPEPLHIPQIVLTSWVKQGAPRGMALNDACTMSTNDDTAQTVRIKGMDLHDAEVLNHIDAGKQVEEISLDWEERLQFKLKADLSLHQIRVSEALIDAQDRGIEDADALFDAEFLIFAGQMRELLTRLDELFGLHQEQAA